MALRVLHVFEPPDGGVAQAVLDLATGLRRHDVDTMVAGPAGAIVRGPLVDAGVPFRDVPLERGYGDPRADAAALRAIVRILRAERFDLVHAHAAKAGMLGRIAARIAGVPAVYSPHCLPFVGDVSRLRAVGSSALERAARPATAALLCVCDDERRIAAEHHLAPAARMHVVHNGCPPPPAGIEPDPRLDRLRGDGGLVVGAVAVLREQKGLADLIAATPAILAGDERARVAIVGDGPLAGDLRERAAAAGVLDDPRFALLPYEGPPARHLAALDLYVLPSLWEAFPIGTLEAMACGVPQVATDVGGVREAVTRDTGILVEPRSPGALSAAVLALLGDAARREAMAAASRARHAERFTVERMVEGTAGVYRAAAAR